MGVDELSDIYMCPFCNKKSFKKSKKNRFLNNTKYVTCNYCESKWIDKGEKGFKLICPTDTIYAYKTLKPYSWEHYRIHGKSFEDEKKDRLEKKREWLLDQYLKGHIEINPNPSIILKKNEFQHLESFTKFYEGKIVSKSTGSYHGFSVPVGKSGFRYRTGSYFGSSSYSHEVKKYITDGNLILTNKRLIFQSIYKTINIHFEHLIGIEPVNNGIIIFRDNSQKPEIFEGIDKDIWILALKNVLENFQNNIKPEGFVYNYDYNEGDSIICPACSFIFKPNLDSSIQTCPICNLNFSCILITLNDEEKMN